MMSPFDVYQDYLALKQHFTGRYDYIKYNGKIRADRDNFERRNDRFTFAKLSKQPDPHNYLLANLLEDPSMWIGQIVTPEGHQRYLSWKKRTESLTYLFQQELNNITKDDFKVVDGQHPGLVQKYMQGEIGMETFIIVCEVTGAVKHFNQKIEDTIVWPDIRTKCMKYSKFMDYDKEKFSKLAVDYFKEL
jgi:hypothetical protein